MVIEKAETKSCMHCGEIRFVTDFKKNKCSLDGRDWVCVDCRKDASRNKNVEASQGEGFYIPDIVLCGVGRTQSYQNCCLGCQKYFFCIQRVRQLTDLFCDDCTADALKLSDRNWSTVNYVGNIVGWVVIVPAADTVRKYKNFKAVFRRDGHQCRYCGYSPEQSETYVPFHVDHVKPWSVGGSNAMDNLVVACRTCNLCVSNKWFDSFEEKKAWILERRKLDLQNGL